MKLKIKISILLISLFAGLPAAYAADEASPPSPLAVLYECADIKDNAARLTCYDAKVSSIKQAEANKEIVAIDSETAKSLKREAFGFSLPSLPKLALPSLGMGDDDDSDRIKSVLVRTSEHGYNRKRFYLENGQVWDQVGAETIRIPKRKSGEPNVVEIKRAALGGFALKLNDKKRTVRVRRSE